MRQKNETNFGDNDMKDEDNEMLSIFQEPQSFESDTVFTCEKCDFAICENIARCPKCGCRMLNPIQEQEKSQNFKSGIYFIVIGILYSIIPIIMIIKNNLGLKQLFEKASVTDFMSVSKFTYMFLFTFCFIGMGGVSIILKKDSLLIRIITVVIVIIAFIAADYLIPKILF